MAKFFKKRKLTRKYAKFILSGSLLELPTIKYDRTKKKIKTLKDIFFPIPNFLISHFWKLMNNICYFKPKNNEVMILFKRKKIMLAKKKIVKHLCLKTFKYRSFFSRLFLTRASLKQEILKNSFNFLQISTS